MEENEKDEFSKELLFEYLLSKNTDADKKSSLSTVNNATNAESQVSQDDLEEIKKQIRSLKSKISGKSLKINELTNKISSLNEKISGNKDKNGKKINEGLLGDIKLIENKFNSYKIDFITIMGLFVSIFTFVSVEIQILKNVCDFWRIAGFSLVMTGSLSLFVLLIHYIGNYWINKEEYNFPWKIFWFACFTPFFLGIWLATLGMFIGKNSCIVTSKDIDKLESRIKELEDEKESDKFFRNQNFNMKK